MNDWNDASGLRILVAEEFNETAVLCRLGLYVNTAARERLRFYIDLYGIDSSHFTRRSTSAKWNQITKDIFQVAASNSQSLRELCIKLGVSNAGASPAVVRQHAVKFGIDISHMSTKRTKGGKYWSTVKIPNDTLFTSNSASRTDTVKTRILKDNLIKYECAVCNNGGVWQGKQLVLQLEHKNGISNDHRLENLEFLCPNCHTQTSTWGSKNKIISQ
jgi:hypothetical protein